MRAQQGFAMVELIVAMLIATLLAVWGAGALVTKMNDNAAQGSAVWMLSVKKAVHSYIERYAAEIVAASDSNALAYKGYADWAAPSLNELKADHLLSPGFPEQGGRGMAAAIRLIRSGNCPDLSCRLEALIHSIQPLARYPSAQADEQMMAQWLMAAQGWGGAVTRMRPDHISGAAFEFMNPPAAGISRLPVGTVAMAITSEQLTSLDFLRIRDGRDPDFQGQATVKGDVHAQSSLNVDKYLWVGAQETALAPCSPEGVIAREYFGGLLVCRGNTWRSAGRVSGGGFSNNSLYGCKNSSGGSTANPVTGACSCPTGFVVVGISDSGPHAAPDGRTRGFLCVE